MVHLTLTFIIVALVLIYGYFTKNVNFFKKLGISYIPGWPLFGNWFEWLIHRKHYTEILQEVYDLDPKAKYVGFFDFTKPIFVIRDLELIKDITIKNFNHFPNHQSIFGEEIDPLSSANLFHLLGDEWRKARNIVSPSFTSSKMKMMYDLIVESAENMVKFLDEISDEDRRMIDAEDLFGKVASDAIASCAFGFKIDSFRNPNNTFFTLTKEVTEKSGIFVFKLFLFKLFHPILKLFKLRLLNERTAKFFTDIVNDAIKKREEEGFIRPDMIHILMEARKTSDLNVNDIVAHTFTFAAAGYRNITVTTAVLANELAINPHIQTKLQNEIDEVMRKYNGKPNYEAINKMLYLDAVYNELMRLHSQAVILDRVCEIPYELPAPVPGGKPVKIQRGSRLFIPVWSIHRDSNYYENPDKFIPERYYGKSVSLNDPLNLSFGIGPRNCIGNRFTIMDMKILLVFLLSKFSLKPNERTCNPFKYSKKDIFIRPSGGNWLTVERRK